MASSTSLALSVVLLLLFFTSPAAAFGAGNIASISKIEGVNFRHGDIEDMLKTIACVKGHKWTSMMIRRVYFGNWLRDYSQALDVGTLKSAQADTIRILVWVLSFMSFGYATAEFEVTKDRLGVYRPEEHIDNPKDYADNADARKYDSRLRPPVQQIELDIDPQTGMKNYIANESLGIATSVGYVKYSLSRSIHFGRMYTSGSSGKGKDDDLCEALRCLGQALHCLEDFGAHTNYVELVLREMGMRDVFPHTGVGTEMNVRGHRVFPLVTGTFGVVDFLHSVIGEATDNLAQSEVDQMNNALGNASTQSRDQSGSSRAGPGGSSSSGSMLGSMTGLLGQIPGAGGLVQQAQNLQAQSDEQERQNAGRAAGQQTFQAPPGSTGGPPTSNIPGTNIDPQKTLAQIYPILEFRDKVARAISATIEKIPGLQKLVEKITETVTLFILSLLAPFIRPIINAVSDSLKTGSSGVIGASGRHQYEPWTDPKCTDPTHSLLSKDHFSNILNEPAGKVASTILQYVAPRVIFAWENPGIDVNQVLSDVVRTFHHPALRDPHCELHRNMYGTVEAWVNARSDRGNGLNQLLGAQSVRDGKNHTKQSDEGGSLGGIPGVNNLMGSHGSSGHKPHGQGGASPFSNIPHMPHIPHIPGASHLPNPLGAFREMPDGGSRDLQSGGYQAQPDYNTHPSQQTPSYNQPQQPAQGPSGAYYGTEPQHQYGGQQQQQQQHPQASYGYDQNSSGAHQYPYNSAPPNYGGQY